MSKLKETVKICMQSTYVFLQGVYLLFYVTAVTGNLFIPVSFIHFVVNIGDLKRVSIQNFCQLKMKVKTLLKTEMVYKKFETYIIKSTSQPRDYEMQVFFLEIKKKTFILIFPCEYSNMSL